MLPVLQLLFAIAGSYLLPPMHAARFRVWDENAQPITLVAYSFSIPQVGTTGDTVRLTMKLHEWDSGGTAERDTVFEVAGVPGGDHEIRFAGLFQASRRVTLSSWSLTAATARSTDSFVVDHGTQPSRDGDAIAASTLILGTSRSDIRWRRAEQSVPMNVDNAFASTEAIQVNYQGWSRVLRPQVRTTMTVTDITDPHHGRRVLVLASDDVLQPGINDFTRELNVARLRPGHSLIELTMGDRVSVSASVQSVEFVLHR